MWSGTFFIVYMNHGCWLQKYLTHSYHKQQYIYQKLVVAHGPSRRQDYPGWEVKPPEKLWKAHSGDGSMHSITIATRARYHCPHADNILSWKSNFSAMGALTYQEKHLEKYPLWYLLPIVSPFRIKVWSTCMWLANSRSQSWALDQG